MNITNALPNYEAICSLLKKHGVSYAGLFGSRAYGDNKKTSDYDILINYDSGSKKSLLSFIDLKQKLEDTLNAKVDLVTENSLSPYLRNNILKNLLTIYGQKN